MSKLRRLKRIVQKKIPIGRPTFKGELGTKVENHVIRKAERKLGYKLMKEEDCKAESAPETNTPDRKKRIETLRKTRRRRNMAPPRRPRRPVRGPAQAAGLDLRRKAATEGGRRKVKVGEPPTVEHQDSIKAHYKKPKREETTWE